MSKATLRTYIGHIQILTICRYFPCVSLPLLGPFSSLYEAYREADTNERPMIVSCKRAAAETTALSSNGRGITNL